MPTQNIFNLLDTWASGGGPYTSIKMNATDNDVGSASLLMDLQVGGVSRFKVAKGGNLTIAGGHLLSTDANALRITDSGGVNAALVTRADFTFIPLASSYGWGDPSSFFQDLLLTRRAAANLRFGAADTSGTSATVTITIAAPGVVTWNNHTLSTGTPVVFTTTGALPTGITAGTTYYAVVVNANTFQLATSVANAIAATPTVITTSGSQSGTHTGTRYNITQRLSMQGITGVADRLGADLIIQGSQGTGTGAGGSIVFQVAPAGSSGTAQNALVDGLTINSNRSITIGTAVTIGGNSAVSSTFSANSFAFLGNGTGFQAYNGAYIGFSSTGTATGTADVLLYRDNTGVLALRNGANAQTFRVYNTTDGTNGNWLELAGGAFSGVYPRIAGTGTNSGLIVAGSATGNSAPLYLRFQYNQNGWRIDTAGNLLAETDNSYDIGASGATRPRNIYAGTSITGPHRMTGTAPASATATGTAGDLRYDADYLYICTATDTWKRVTIATWP